MRLIQRVRPAIGKAIGTCRSWLPKAGSAPFSRTLIGVRAVKQAAQRWAARITGFRATSIPGSIHTSIRTRLLGAISLLAVVALLVAGVGAHALYQLNQHLHTLINVTSQRWMLSSEMQRELVSLDRGVQLLVLETDSALVARDSRAIDAGQQQILTHLKQLQTLAGPDDTARLTTFSDDFAEYQSLVEAIDTDIQQSRRDSARQFALNQGQALFQDANQALNQIGLSASREMQEARRRADTSWRETRNLLLLISIGGIGLGVTLASLLMSGVLRSLLQVAGRMQEIASGDGDLSQRLPEQGKDEVSDLCRSFNHFLGQIEQIVAQVASSTHRLSAASETISTSMGRQARGAGEQQSQTEAVGHSIREMAASASAVATHAGSATGGAQRAARSAHAGGEVIRQAIQQMRAIAVSVDDAAERVRQLSRSSEQISEIIEVIDQIADQTKLLALNAAIEAARAGDHGRGFAVVADSVRSLSETTSSATHDIATRLKGIHTEAVTTVKAMQAGNAHVTQTVQTAEQASVALREILETADQVGTMVHEIASAAEQQSAMTVQVQSNMDEMDRITRQSAAATRQVAESCGELSQLAHELEGLIERFRLSGSVTETAAVMTRDGRPQTARPPLPG